MATGEKHNKIERVTEPNSKYTRTDTDTEYIIHNRVIITLPYP